MSREWFDVRSGNPSENCNYIWEISSYKEDLQYLFFNKSVVVIGDSVQRGIYKDLVCHLQNDRLLKASELKCKGELEHCGDNLLYGGRKRGLTNGTSYREVRSFQSPYYSIRFYFMTAAHNEFFKKMLKDLRKIKPDIIIINSCLWDISRYGFKNYLERYAQKLHQLLAEMQEVMSSHTLFMWLTGLPLGDKVRGGFLSGAEQHRNRLKVSLAEANYLASSIVDKFQHDVLDLNFIFSQSMSFIDRHREKDGIHWDPIGHRAISNLIVSRLFEAFGRQRPKRDFVTRREMHRWFISQMNDPALDGLKSSIKKYDDRQICIRQERERRKMERHESRHHPLPPHRKCNSASASTHLDKYTLSDKCERQ